MLALNWADLIKRPERSRVCDEEMDSDPTPDEIKLLKNFSILLFIDLSKIRSSSDFCKVISEQIIMRHKSHISLLTQYIDQHQENCCIILDGWDEYAPCSCHEVTGLVHGRLWPDAYVMVTSRIREQTVLPQNMDHQSLVKGFSKEKAELFVRKMLASVETKDLILFIKKHHMWELFLIPLMLNFLCCLYLSDIPLQSKITLLFTSMIHCTIGKHKLREMKLESSSLANVPLESYKDELMALGELATIGLLGENTKTVFSETEVNDIVGEPGLTLGLLSMVKTQDRIGTVTYQFPHRVIQEYLAAIYIAQESTNFVAYLNSLIKIYDHRLLVRFICGLNRSYGQRILERIQELSESSSVTAAQCPEFSIRGWFTDRTNWDDLALMHTERGSEIAPFVIKCCWEMLSDEDQSHSFANFPFIQTQIQRPVVVEPKLDFKELDVRQIIQLIEYDYIQFKRSSTVVVCNLKITPDNSDEASKLF